MGWTLLIPVKRLAEAKSRLRRDLGRLDLLRADVVADPAELDPDELALAMALDTVAAAALSRRVSRILVITADPAARLAALALGLDVVEVVEDRPDAGLNPALSHAITELAEIGPAASLGAAGVGAAGVGAAGVGAAGVGALAADLPALRTGELTDALRQAEALGVPTFVADAAGVGTVLLTAPTAADLRPRFGRGSAAAHAAGGAVGLREDWPSLRRDVDTAADLADALGLGVGRHTAATGIVRAVRAVQR